MITPTLVVKNGERRLEQVLSALSSFKEVILVDTGSADETLTIAKKFPNVCVSTHPFSGFGEVRNEAARRASSDWILAIDADEVLSPELIEEIHTLSLDPSTVYAIPYRNFFNNKWIKGCGWYPEKHIRLYHRKRTQFSTALVHEGVISHALRIQTLCHHISHYSYDNISDFLTKLDHYSTLFAHQYQDKKKATPWIAITHGLWAFFKSYFLKRGFLCGWEGFLISRYQGETAFYKYLKLYFAHKKK